jgi:hypothetical protein
MMPRNILLFSLILIGTLTACDAFQEDESVVPTIADVEDAATAIVLTENAPPEGFQTVSYNEIDVNLSQLAYSRFEIDITFEGIYADTNEPTMGSMHLEAVANELTVAREVDIEFDGDIFSGESSDLKAVRLSNNYYMINPNGVCITETSQIQEIANIRAGQIIGGVESAGTTGTRREINGYQAWQYGFAPEALVRPQLQTTAELDLLTGEMWVVPEFQVVIRYIIEMNVENAQLLFGNRPVTGRVRFEYNVYDINLEQNISIPNGC